MAGISPSRVILSSLLAQAFVDGTVAAVVSPAVVVVAACRVNVVMQTVAKTFQTLL